jgi:hypothetical protein
MQHVLAIRHVAFEGLGTSAIESWLVGHAVELVHANVDLQSLCHTAPVASTAGKDVLRKWLLQA